MTQHDLTRRATCAAIPAFLACPALALDQAKRAPDPFLAAFEDWRDATIEWERLAALPGNEELDTPACLSAESRGWDAYRRMGAATPNSREGLAALAWTLRETFGPDAGDGGHPADHALIEVLWRFARGPVPMPRHLWQERLTLAS